MAYESDIINIAVVNFKVASGEKEVNLRRMRTCPVQRPEEDRI